MPDLSRMLSALRLYLLSFLTDRRVFPDGSTRRLYRHYGRRQWAEVLSPIRLGILVGALPYITPNIFLFWNRPPPVSPILSNASQWNANCAAFQCSQRLPLTTPKSCNKHCKT
ncbi:hypothetical protein PLICRDRAFT_239235 [Plicaturopsis crispa FD-325 SS-3]|nr:hypothetical protein PLICRDRAFT_239235 [Plicaturopsis crispa FD-325 SS-3]